MKVKKVIRGGKEVFLVELQCPGCGRKGTAETDYVSSVIEAKCSRCQTKFSLTYDNGVDEARRAFMLGEDHDESPLVIIEGRWERRD